MKCPRCKAKSQTIESRPSAEGLVIRRRLCKACFHGFLTQEVYGEPGLKLPRSHRRPKEVAPADKPITSDGAALQAFMQSAFR